MCLVFLIKSEIKYFFTFIRRFNKLGKTTYRNSLSQQKSAPSRQVVIKQEPVQLGRGYR